VHVAGLVELAHGGVYQRVACAGLAPGVKQLVAVGAVVPMDGVVIALEALACAHVRKVGQHLHIKVAPDQLRKPDRCASAARQAAFVRHAGQLPDGHGAKTQMGAQVAGALQARVVAGAVIGVDTRGKVLQQGLAAAFAAGQMQGVQVAGLKVQVA